MVSRNRVANSDDNGCSIWNGTSDCLLDCNSSKKSALNGFLVLGSVNIFIENRAVRSQDFDLRENASGTNLYVDNSFPSIGP